MQVDSITNHLGMISVSTTSYESYVEIICTFCQTINHTNQKAVQEKNHHKALQAEFQQADGHGCGGREENRSEGYGNVRGRGQARGSNQGG